MTAHNFSIAFILGSNSSTNGEHNNNNNTDVKQCPDDKRTGCSDNDILKDSIDLKELKSSTPTAIVRPAPNFNAKNSYRHEKG